MLTALLPLVLVDLLLFTAVGVMVIAWLPPAWRGRLLPGAPALGAATLVVALHLTSLLVGVRVGAVLALVVGAVAVALRSWRCRWWRTLERTSWMLLVAGLIAGAIPLFVVVQPFRTAGATVVQPTTNNDAFYYVSLTDWLLDHSALTVPVVGIDPPAYGNTRETLHQGLRLGEEMDAGAVTAITRSDPIATWSTTTIMWLFFIPGACIAACEVIGLARVAGVLAGVLTAGSAVVAAQVLNQNSSAMLGILIAPLAIALWARYFDPDDGRGRALSWAGANPVSSVGSAPAETRSAALDRPPLWLAVLVFDGLVGAYTEYLATIGVGLVAYVALRPARMWLTAVSDSLRFGAFALVLGPLIWYDAERSLRLTATLGGPSGSPFGGVPLGTRIARVVGTSPYDATSGVRPGLALAAWMAAGVILAVLWSPGRRILALVTLNAVGTALFLGSPLHHFPYGQYRAVGMGISIVLITAVAGWVVGIQRLAGGATRVRAVSALVVGALGATLLFGLNQRTIAEHALEDWSARTVSADFDQSATWAASRGAQDGASVTALMPDFFTQLWSMYALRKSPKINFPFLYPDYAQVPPLTYDDGRLRRFVLVGGDLFTHIDPATVVGGNSRFRYLDTSRGSVVLAFGVENVQSLEAGPRGQVQQWMINGGRLLVAHTPDVRAITLTLRANPMSASMPVSIAADGAPGRDLAVGQSDVTVTIPLGASTMSVVLIDNHVPALRPNASDPRLLSVLVEGVGPG